MRGRGRPGEFEARLRRAEALSRSGGEPVAFLVVLLRHQIGRLSDDEVRGASGRMAAGAVFGGVAERFPLLDPPSEADAIGSEVRLAATTIDRSVTPEPLAAAADYLATLADDALAEAVSAWLDDGLQIDPRVGVWMGAGAGPVLESAAARVRIPSREEWTGRACPLCGDVPRCSAIVEESGGFLQGAPRYLLCGRCSAWWAFARATCAWCGEDDSTRLASHVSDEWPYARVDSCDACRGYLKSFDLRHKGAREAVPLVDDVATPALDLWARESGLQRPTVSLAGV